MDKRVVKMEKREKNSTSETEKGDGNMASASFSVDRDYYPSIWIHDVPKGAELRIEQDPQEPRCRILKIVGKKTEITIHFYEEE